MCVVSMLIAFDPALRTSGVAVFQDARLIHAYHVVNPCFDRGPASWAVTAECIWSGIATAYSAHLPCLIVTEEQVVYPQSKSDPNDILQVAGVAGALVGIGRAVGCEVRSYAPATWKGQLPKNVCMQRTKAKLSDIERGCIVRGTTLDAWDAIGIGLYHLHTMKMR